MTCILQGNCAEDFIPRLVAERNILIDKGICPECHSDLLVSWKKFGFTEMSKTEIIISCPKCGYEPKD